MEYRNGEARLIFADALCYADSLGPRLVADVATLTGPWASPCAPPPPACWWCCIDDALRCSTLLPEAFFTVRDEDHQVNTQHWLVNTDHLTQVLCSYWLISGQDEHLQQHYNNSEVAENVDRWADTGLRALPRNGLCGADYIPRLIDSKLNLDWAQEQLSQGVSEEARRGDCRGDSWGSGRRYSLNSVQHLRRKGPQYSWKTVPIPVQFHSVDQEKLFWIRSAWFCGLDWVDDKNINCISLWLFLNLWSSANKLNRTSRLPGCWTRPWTSYSTSKLWWWTFLRWSVSASAGSRAERFSNLSNILALEGVGHVTR